MDNHILKKTIEHLRDFKVDKIKEIKANIITENGADEFCDFINYEVENSFTLLFGREHFLENETGENDNGILNKFNYKDDKKCKFAVMLSYWNYVKDNNDKGKIDDNRKNSFYKGKRWSNIDNRKNFYFYFNILKERLGSGNVPVSFLVKMFIGNSNYIKIITAGSLDEATEKPINKKDANHFIIYFPELFEKITIENINHPNLKEFGTLILRYKEEKNNILFDRDNINQESIKNENAYPLLYLNKFLSFTATVKSLSNRASP